MSSLFAFQDGLARIYLDHFKLPSIGERKEERFHDLGMHQRLTETCEANLCVSLACPLCGSTYRGGGYGRRRLIRKETVHHLFLPEDVEGLGN